METEYKEIDDRAFAIGAGLYYYSTNYHEGQFSDLYALSCCVGYQPGVLETEDLCFKDMEEAREVYEECVAGGLDKALSYAEELAKYSGMRRLRAFLTSLNP